MNANSALARPFPPDSGLTLDGLFLFDGRFIVWDAFVEKLLRQVLLVSGLGSGSAQAIAIAIILGISTVAYIRRNPLIERNLNYQQVRTYTTPTQPTDKHRNLSRLSSSLMLRCLPFLRRSCLLTRCSVCCLPWSFPRCPSSRYWVRSSSSSPLCICWSDKVISSRRVISS